MALPRHKVTLPPALAHLCSGHIIILDTCHFRYMGCLELTQITTVPNEVTQVTTTHDYVSLKPPLNIVLLWDRYSKTITKVSFTVSPRYHYGIATITI